MSNSVQQRDIKLSSIIYLIVVFSGQIMAVNLTVGRFQEIKHIMTLEDRRICYQEFQDVGYETSPDIGLSIDEILNKYGYPCERIDVMTSDGYILGVYRIPYSPKSPLVKGETKPAVYLNHGQGATGLVWLIQPMSRNLATLLADNGYDVFIGNARGNSYSQGHINPNITTRTLKYWDFSFHEMGVYDVPAVIDMITEVTGNSKIYYIGHSMGTTEIVITLSERPDYNKRLSTVFLLAPAVYLKHIADDFIGLVRYTNYYQYYFNIVLRGKLEANRIIEKRTGRPPGYICAEAKHACGLCGDFLFSQYGYDGAQMNYTSLGVFIQSFPDTISTKCWTHFVQLIESNTFCQFNYGFTFKNYLKYGSRRPPCYHMENISAPTVIYYGQNDIFDVPQDVARTASKIHSLKEFNRIEHRLFTHLDFCIAKDADVLLYNRVLATMKNQTYG